MVYNDITMAGKGGTKSGWDVCSLPVLIVLFILGGLIVVILNI